MAMENRLRMGALRYGEGYLTRLKKNEEYYLNKTYALREDGDYAIDCANFCKLIWERDDTGRRPVTLPDMVSEDEAFRTWRETGSISVLPCLAYHLQSRPLIPMATGTHEVVM